MVLYIGYNNGPSDGGCAQLHRICAIYCIARRYRVRYVHQPITYICCKGLVHIQANQGTDPAFEEGFNSLLQPNEHFSEVPEGARTLVLSGDLDVPKLLSLMREAEKEDIFAKVSLCRPIIETDPDLYRYAIELSPLPSVTSKDHLNIQIHMRRGDLLVGEQWRMLPNSYYLGLIHFFNKVVPQLGKTHTIHIHTEAPLEEIVLTSEHHGVGDRIKTDLVLKPSEYRLEEFDLPNVVLHNNEDPWTSVRALQTGDVLVMSHSSFSIIGAIMNPKGIILYHPFWHKPMTRWLNTTSPSFPNKFIDALVTL
jgi:hypothetical protein